MEQDHQNGNNIIMLFNWVYCAKINFDIPLQHIREVSNNIIILTALQNYYKKYYYFNLIF